MFLLDLPLRQLDLRLSLQLLRLRKHRLSSGSSSSSSGSSRRTRLITRPSAHKRRSLRGLCRSMLTLGGKRALLAMAGKRAVLAVGGGGCLLAVGGRQGRWGSVSAVARGSGCTIAAARESVSAV